MKMLMTLLRDECGFVLSAESVLLGTVGVIGATVGLSAVSSAVNEELTDVARAIRSVDQSYHYHGMSGCGSCVSGSSYTQEPVAVSLKHLETEIDQARTEETKKQGEAVEKSHSSDGESKPDHKHKSKAREEKRRKAREARERDRKQLETGDDESAEPEKAPQDDVKPAESPTSL